MKIPQKSKEKKNKIKKKEQIKPRKEQVLVVAQEIKFARLLSGNEKKGRDKVLKTLKKWLLNCFEKNYEFKEDDFVRMWKGLFYAVWMSDKPLIQEELCDNIGAVLDLFGPEHLKSALLMYKAGLRVLATEWFGIDQHRMDKFLMLVRRYLRASLRCLLRCDWSLASCQLYAGVISGSDGIFALKTPRYARNASSMLSHIMDCYLEEIAKVSSGSIPEASLAELLRPMCAYMCGGENIVLCCAARRLLTALLRQSPAALRYQQATRAWHKMGCPEGGPDALELVSDDDEDDEEQNGDSDDGGHDSSEKPLDPRAGRVDVELALLPVPSGLLADMLRDLLASANSKAHKRVRICLERFEKLARDEFPLKIKTHVEEETVTPVVRPKNLARSLQVLEKQLVTSSDELALRGLSRKHRKRLLAKSRSGLSIVEDVEAVREETNATNGFWQVESLEKVSKKRKNHNSKVEPQKRRKIEMKEDVRPKTFTNKKEVVNKKLNNKEPNNKLLNNIELNNKEPIKKELNNKKSNNIDVINKEPINKELNNKKPNNIEVNNKELNNKKPNNIEVNNKDLNHKKPNNIEVKNKEPINKELNNKQRTNRIKNKTHINIKSKNIKKDKVGKQTHIDTPKKVKFVLKNNSMQAPHEYYKSIRQSPQLPFDSSKRPSKTNLKPSTPSPINPFYRKKLKLK